MEGELQSRWCLIRAMSFCETKTHNPATYIWLEVMGDGDSLPFALAGLLC